MSEDGVDDVVFKDYGPGLGGVCGAHQPTTDGSNPILSKKGKKKKRTAAKHGASSASSGLDVRAGLAYRAVLATLSDSELVRVALNLGR